MAEGNVVVNLRNNIQLRKRIIRRQPIRKINKNSNQFSTENNNNDNSRKFNHN